ncbi:hypothetical protein GKODMF_12605 [Candidatus Electrothrix gigas]
MTPSKSSAYLLLLVGYTYLMSFPYRPSFILYFCLQQTLQRAGLSQLEPGFFAFQAGCSLIPFILPEKNRAIHPLPSGTQRASQVPVCFSSYMPRPQDTGRPSRISPFHSRFLCIGFRYSENVAICVFDYYGAVPCFRGVPFPLWPI